MRRSTFAIYLILLIEAVLGNLLLSAYALPEAGSPEGNREAACSGSTCSPLVPPTPTPSVQCPAETKFDYLSNTCKACAYVVTFFRENLIRDAQTGQFYGDANYEHPNAHSVTLDRNDVLVTFGSPDSAPVISQITSAFTAQADYCFNPMTSNSSECFAYYVYSNWMQPIRKEKDWGKYDSSWSYRMVNDTQWYFDDITRVWLRDPVTGNLTPQDTPQGVFFNGVGPYAFGGDVAFFDRNGNRITPSAIVDVNTDNATMVANREPNFRKDSAYVSCYKWEVRGIASPVSLLMPNCQYGDPEPTIVQFPLDPNAPDAYTVWKASACMPLLVVDPEDTGKITSARQLIGEWTNGGKPALKGKPTKWKHGFDALGSFDTDRDGALRDAELAPLRAWVDANQNGISEAGEVVDLADLGVSRLAYKGPMPLGNGDLVVEAGFTLAKDGDEQRGDLVDWFSKIADSSLTLKTFLPRKAIPDETSPQLDYKVDCKRSSGSVAGAWRWWLEDDPNKVTQGIMTLDSQGHGTLRGLSYSISNASLQGTDLATMLGVWHMKATQDGTRADFELQTARGSVLSKVELTDDGAALKGRTRATSGQGDSYAYSWRAERLGCGS